MSAPGTLNSGVPRRSKWSGFETDVDDLTASSALPTQVTARMMTHNRPSCDGDHSPGEPVRATVNTGEVKLISVGIEEEPL
jgi:hypothetical protein